MAIDRLGDSIRRGEEDPSTSVALQTWRGEHDPALADLQDQLVADGITTSSRIKSPQRIRSKLLRQEHLRLSQMQDVAGLRHVAAVGLRDQEALAEKIRGAIGGTIDNRVYAPSHGYRAVHVIVRRDGFLIEVQLRTRDQNEWAQLMEHLADACDPEIQYGAEPAYPYARELRDRLLMLSQRIFELEVNDQLQQSLDSISSPVLDAARTIAAQDREWQARVQNLEASIALGQQHRETLRVQVSDEAAAIATGIESLFTEGCH